MENLFELHADVRGEQGKGASRRLRRAGKVPAILYGAGKEPVSLTLDHNLLFQHLGYEAFYSHILTIHANGKTEKAVLKALQRDPANPNKVLHLDLQRVSPTQKLSISVHLHFMGDDVARGVRQEGGVVARLLNDVEITCLAKDLPESIEVDLTDLGAGEALHLSDLKLPEGVEIPALKLGEDYDQPVVTIHKPRVAEEEEAGTEGGAEAAE
ncbi:ribosomal 5S rRNA E-loop binding protein Ctc/L25/TL5 [Nitrosococcus halophilus Nc 4]|uniref:Large ribosomal subunit protein bL25 n=1 Tax=Nitrosococcus halophilus (strain Nc4) TaxID=472759 RepID=D5C3Z5_NITHN|nr:50S ribosomal protein L25/general stress protein Ctc [Nitrosococcus halophilus]ADE16932.1 ribosomal 5S rRNA E-loop binding protein Ctc/L25/TL5 [Nitrosococcus halophilus Nc 4]